MNRAERLALMRTAQRIEAQLRINRLTNSPSAPWALAVDDPKSRMRAQIGNYHLSGAYGGVCLHQLVNEGGGVRDVLQCGHVPKRLLYDMMHAFIAGMEVKP